MIDRIESWDGTTLVALKNCTVNEWVVDQSSTTDTRYPETCVIEAAAQAALLFYRSLLDQEEVGSFFLAKIDATFFARVAVGDQLVLTVGQGKVLRDRGYAIVEVTVAGERIASVTLYAGRSGS